jgi:hypothetical protein
MSDLDLESLKKKGKKGGKKKKKKEKKKKQNTVHFNENVKMKLNLFINAFISTVLIF